MAGGRYVGSARWPVVPVCVRTEAAGTRQPTFPGCQRGSRSPSSCVDGVTTACTIAGGSTRLARAPALRGLPAVPGRPARHAAPQRGRAAAGRHAAGAALCARAAGERQVGGWEPCRCRGGGGGGGGGVEGLAGLCPDRRAPPPHTWCGRGYGISAGKAALEYRVQHPLRLRPLCFCRLGVDWKLPQGRSPNDHHLFPLAPPPTGKLQGPVHVSVGQGVQALRHVHPCMCLCVTRPTSRRVSTGPRACPVFACPPAGGRSVQIRKL